MKKNNYRYRNPKRVNSPIDKINKIDLLYEDKKGGVSLAKIKWGENEVIGIRWNISMREWNEPQKINGNKECVGMPVSRGYPTWFILPDDFLKKGSDLDIIMEKLKAQNNDRNIQND